MNVLLTTFPSHKSRNVGDALITESAIQLVRYRVRDYRPEVLFREQSLDHFEKESIRTILLPGFSVNANSYPNFYSLFSDLSGVTGKIYLAGCSFQDPIPTDRTYSEYRYDERNTKFLKALQGNLGSIPCRDVMIKKMLEKNGIASSYMGDLALYDDKMISKKFRPPRSVRSIAFTIGHNKKFFSQSKKLLSLIKRDFKDAKLYVVHHSKPNNSSKKISDFATSLGYIEKDLSGSAENLDFYKEIDIHVGYRLHGHLYFLRNRKPSFLLAEDSRSFGISRSGALRTGILQALEEDGVTVNESAPYDLMKFVRSCIKDRFSSYYEVFNFIDDTYNSTVRPMFDRFCREIGWRPSLLVRVINCLKRKA